MLALLTALLPLAAAVPCVQFDANWNLYAFGGDKDVNLGAASTWGSPSATDLPTTGRPPWTGTNTQCMLSQSNNALYVYGADASDLGSIYIYDFAGNSWSTQATSSAPSSIGNSRSAAVLDHDTNVIYTLAGDSNTMYQLDLGSVTNTASGTPAWALVENPSFTATNYEVTAALAANHILYYGVPGTAAGSANLFVIHYAYFQPTAQEFSGTAFPDTTGQVVSIPTTENSTPYQNLFVPKDFSGAYITTHWTDLGNYSVTSDSPMSLSLVNSTQTFPVPTSQDAQAAYACSPSACVQIDTTGNIYYVDNAISSYQVASGAAWTKMGYSLTPASSTAAAASGTGASGSTASGSGAAAAAAKTDATGKSSSTASGAAASSTVKSAAGTSIRSDVLGFTLAAVALVAATMI